MNENILINKKVLVAEDNAINQIVVKRSLQKLGASADVVSNGAEAIEKLKANPYDLILMDIQMPVMDGYETTGYIRNQLRSNAPIIAMTAFSINGEDEKCYEFGMNAYISKPFTVEDLNAVIKKVLTVKSDVSFNPYIFSRKEVSVDVSMLYDISGDDESYITMMVQTFLENMPGTLEKIQQYYSEENWQELYQAAHYAKSMLSVIKIGEMFDAVIAIETNAKNKSNLQLLPQLIEKVNRSFSVASEILTDKFHVSYS